MYYMIRNKNADANYVICMWLCNKLPPNLTTADLNNHVTVSHIMWNLSWAWQSSSSTSCAIN